jgi:ATP-binding cassette subfamily B protein
VVRFEDVEFRYRNSGRPVLDGLELEVGAGEVLAIVGVNGAGKTTLTKLLAGLHQPTRGRITVDGADLRTLDPLRWRRRVSAVFQDFVHYPATLRDNIGLAAPEHPVRDDQVLAAAQAAGALPLIERLPHGLDTPLWQANSSGVDLSGGQWQRLAVARALYAVAHGRQLVVLDEPTAHLDVPAEAEFFERVVAAVRDVSVILISHRLSTVRRADRIAVLSDGRVTECDPHERLMASDGEYAKLFRLQASRFTGDAMSGVR